MVRDRQLRTWERLSELQRALALEEQRKGDMNCQYSTSLTAARWMTRARPAVHFGSMRVFLVWGGQNEGWGIAQH